MYRIALVNYGRARLRGIRLRTRPRGVAESVITGLRPRTAPRPRRIDKPSFRDKIETPLLFFSKILRGGFSMSLFGMSENEAISKLQPYCGMIIGQTVDYCDAIKIINKVEKSIPTPKSAKLESLVGCALSTYVFHCVRGDDRKAFIERAIGHYEKSYRLDPSDSTAFTLGLTLISEAQIRDLDKGIAYIEPLYLKSKRYEPVFCSYADAYYQKGDFERAIKITKQLEAWCGKGKEFDVVPPAVLTIRAKAHRALIRQHKKAKENEKAVKLLKEMVSQGIASANDRAMLEKMK